MRWRYRLTIHSITAWVHAGGCSLIENIDRTQQLLPHLPPWLLVSCGVDEEEIMFCPALVCKGKPQVCLRKRAFKLSLVSVAWSWAVGVFVGTCEFLGPGYEP